ALGDGHGGFGAPASVLALQSGPRSVALGDVTEDGTLDLLIAGSINTFNNVTVWRGTGTGAFAFFSQLSTGAYAVEVFLGDLNGDGKLDLLATDYTGIDVKLGLGAGAFSPKTHTATGSWPTEAAIVDLDGDGKLDVATANQSGNSISVRLGDGLGGF